MCILLAVQRSANSHYSHHCITYGGDLLYHVGEPNMPDRIIMALKLSSIVHGTSTSDRGRREAPAVAPKLDIGTDHKIYRKSSHLCGHQEVCEVYNPEFIYTQPGKVLYQCHS